MWPFQGPGQSKEGTVDCLGPDPSRLRCGSEAKTKAEQQLQSILTGEEIEPELQPEEPAQGNVLGLFSPSTFYFIEMPCLNMSY